MLKIIPSILTNNPQELYELLKRAGAATDRVSIDIIDGRFAANKTITPESLFDFETDLKIDYQLMVEEPAHWVEKCVRGQADRIIGHIEKMNSQEEFVKRVQEVGLPVGLGLDLVTPVESLDEAVISDLDVVLVMSVPAGFGGQGFEVVALDKIRKLDEIRERDKTPFAIQDDGGITLEYIDDLRVAGVDEVSIGRRIFKGDVKKNIDQFLKAAYGR